MEQDLTLEYIRHLRVKKSFVFYGTQKLSILFTRINHWTLSRVIWTNFVLLFPSSFHLRLSQTCNILSHFRLQIMHFLPVHSCWEGWIAQYSAHTTGCGAEQSLFDSWYGQGNYISSKTPRPALKAHPTSHSAHTGSYFAGGKANSARSWAHLHVVSMLRMSGSIPPLQRKSFGIFCYYFT
jgi:hypothetical protein